MVDGKMTRGAVEKNVPSMRRRGAPAPALPIESRNALASCTRRIAYGFRRAPEIPLLFDNPTAATFASNYCRLASRWITCSRCDTAARTKYATINFSAPIAIHAKPSTTWIPTATNTERENPSTFFPALSFIVFLLAHLVAPMTQTSRLRRR